jgi:hypothetical protein
VFLVFRRSRVQLVRLKYDNKKLLFLSSYFIFSCDDTMKYSKKYDIIL